MKLGRRSQSMPWISCPGIISTERRRGEKETDTNQSLWRHLDYTSPPTPSIHPLSPACHHQALPLSTLLLFICFSVFSVVCLPLGWKLCVYMCSIMYVCVCVCVKALWNDALIHSVLYFLIWLTITVRVNRRRISLSLSRSLFLLLSPYFSPSFSLSVSIRVSCCWMEVFTRSFVLPLQETGLECECMHCAWAVCFIPVHACVYFYVLFSNLEHGVKYSGVYALLVQCVGAYGSAGTYTVYLTACLSGCQISFSLFIFF